MIEVCAAIYVGGAVTAAGLASFRGLEGLDASMFAIFWPFAAPIALAIELGRWLLRERE